MSQICFQSIRVAPLAVANDVVANKHGFEKRKTVPFGAANIKPKSLPLHIKIVDAAKF
jgi:hypothetical protein